MRRRSSLLRGAFYLVSTALIVLAGFTVPLPFVETQPGAPTEIAPLVEIDGVEVTELHGTASLLTIRQRDQAVFPALWILLDDDRSLSPVEEVFPPGVDRDEYHTAQRQRFRRQFEVAAAVGAQAAGVDVEIATAVEVLQVLPESSAHGLLLPGDIITAVDGEPLEDAAQLQAITEAGSLGDELTLTVLRDGQQEQVTATLGTIPGEDGPRLGIAIADGVERLELPFDVALREGTRIGGPSAGLMVALTVYDLLSDEDLLAGRIVVGTGSLSSNGNVGRVGGVPQKMVAAEAYGADLVLVPEQQLGEARAAASAELDIIGVATLEEALEALRHAPS